MHRSRSDLLRTLASAVLVAGVSFLVFWLRVPHPFVWIWLTALPLCGILALRVNAEWLRAILVVSFGIVLGLLVSESALIAPGAFRSDDVTITDSYASPGSMVNGGPLGYAPTPGSRHRSIVTVRQRVIIDAVYTFTEHGARATKGSPGGDTWLFMGCSYTFGEGLNDDETLPSHFSKELGYAANVVNLAFRGYGAHQMLRSLELDLPRPSVHPPVRQLVYTALWPHVIRSAGRAQWDAGGPSYVLTEASVAYAGPFHRRPTVRVLNVLQRSRVFQLVLERTLFRYSVSDEDIEQYGRIVERSAQLAREKYGTGLTVVFWDYDNENSRRVLARLQNSGIPIILVSQLMPRTEWDDVSIPVDGHPSAEANRRLAKALVARLKARETTDSSMTRPAGRRTDDK